MTSPLCVATGGWCRRVFHYRPPTPMYRNSPPLCTIVLQIPSLMPLKMRKVQLVLKLSSYLPWDGVCSGLRGREVSDPWTETVECSPPGAKPTTPCLTGAKTGPLAKSCNARTEPFASPLPDEMVDRGVSFGPKYVAVEQLAEQAKSIRPAAKQVKAMKQRNELDAAVRIKSLEAVTVELAELQAAVDAVLARLLQPAYPGETESQR